MSLVQRHFTTATFVVDRSQAEPRVLLLKHKKLASWLPPGGHIEENELSHESALREVGEESGLKVKLIGGNAGKKINDRVSVLPAPHHIQLEEIEAGKHYHIDLVYFAVAEDGAEIRDNESHGQIRWFTEKELLAIPENEIFSEARKWALEAVGGMGRSK